MKKFKIPIILFVISIILRILPIFQNAVSFHYDMARDAFVAQKIIHGDLKVMGPPSSTPGLSHGVLYYYLLALLYLIGNGNPIFVSAVLSILSSLSIFPVYFLAQDFFKNKRMGILAGILFATSFEATQYAPWISNPSLALLCLAFYFYGLWLWKNDRPSGFLLAITSAVLATQFQLFLSTLFIVTLLFWIIFKTKVNKKGFILAVLIVLVGLGSYFIAFGKFGTYAQIWSIISQRIPTNQFVFRIQFTDVILNYINRFADIYINNFFPSNILLGGILGIVCLVTSRSSSFVLFTLLISLPIFIFGGHNSNYVNLGMVFPGILSVLIVFKTILKKNKFLAVLLLLVIFGSNLYTIIKLSPRGQLSMVIPKDMVLNKQFNLIDKTYEIAAGRPFSINTLTLPLWVNTTWSYLYSWYGKSKYGYVPSFYGHDQVGSEGDGTLPEDNTPKDPAFFIIEPQDGIPQNLITSELSSENAKTEIVNQYDYGALLLQERRVLNKTP
ncbi:MAG: glycosyltransferase family 39 protein [Patescibacteria group bacterium]